MSSTQDRKDTWPRGAANAARADEVIECGGELLLRFARLCGANYIVWHALTLINPVERAKPFDHPDWLFEAKSLIGHFSDIEK